MKKKTYTIVTEILLRIVILPICLLFVSSCYPEFSNGLPPGDKVQVDKQITGSWFSETKYDKQQLLIYPRKNGWVDIIFVYDIESETSKDGINVLVFEGYSVTMANQMLMCLRPRKKDLRITDKDNKPKNFSFIILKYSFSDKGELVIENFSVEKIGQLIKQEKLEGKLFDKDPIKGRLFQSVLVTSSSEMLADVLSKEGPDQLVGGSGPYSIFHFSRKK